MEHCMGIFAMNAHEPFAAVHFKVLQIEHFWARSGYRPQCFQSAALVGGCCDVTSPYLMSRLAVSRFDWRPSLFLLPASCPHRQDAGYSVQDEQHVPFDCTHPQSTAHSFRLRVLESTSTRPISPTVWLPASSQSF
eukprot:148124-Pelagomonas_calceolata.AAC.1